EDGAHRRSGGEHVLAQEVVAAVEGDLLAVVGDEDEVVAGARVDRPAVTARGQGEERGHPAAVVAAAGEPGVVVGTDDDEALAAGAGGGRDAADEVATAGRLGVGGDLDEGVHRAAGGEGAG